MLPDQLAKLDEISQTIVPYGQKARITLPSSTPSRWLQIGAVAIVVAETGGGVRVTRPVKTIPSGRNLPPRDRTSRVAHRLIPRAISDTENPHVDRGAQFRRGAFDEQRCVPLGRKCAQRKAVDITYWHRNTHLRGFLHGRMRMLVFHYSTRKSTDDFWDVIYSEVLFVLREIGPVSRVPNGMRLLVKSWRMPRARRIAHHTISKRFAFWCSWSPNLCFFKNSKN